MGGTILLIVALTIWTTSTSSSSVEPFQWWYLIEIHVSFACSILVAESYSNNAIQLVEDVGSPEKDKADRINSETWEPLEKLAKGEVWQCVWCLSLIYHTFSVWDKYETQIIVRVHIECSLQLVFLCSTFLIFCFNYNRAGLALHCTFRRSMMN